MQMDLRTVSIKPLRNTFDHVARRIGDKPASRYQEGTLDIQAAANFQYRPTWDPQHEIFDTARTALKMADWYDFKDPRQYYYGTYTLARARQQDTAESSFDFVETHGLVATLPEDLKRQALALLVPLRHVAWGSNMNNAAICAYGYGTGFTQPCLYQSMDQLGIAQYLSRIGLLLGDVEALDAGKEAWLDDAAWQSLRRYVEDTFVLKDPFELYVAQNVALDGLLYPLVYETIVNGVFASEGGPTLAMLTQFMNTWFAETRKWVDATLKTAAGESPANKALLEQWTTHWRDRAASALTPVAQIALGQKTDAVMADVIHQFNARLAKAGVAI